MTCLCSDPGLLAELRGSAGAAPAVGVLPSVLHLQVLLVLYCTVLYCTVLLPPLLHLQVRLQAAALVSAGAAAVTAHQVIMDWPLTELSVLNVKTRLNITVDEKWDV